ncbi:O-methyltransferase gsfB [Talaromyces pinophilus]|nr:O-methyltransferase gsfB [Talaromyces pinophilus]
MELAAVISHAVEQIQGILSEKQLPSPSFHENSPYVLPPEAVGYQGKVLDAAGELCDLLVDLFTLLFQHGGHSNMICQQVITHFKIADLVLLGGQLSFSEIAKSIGYNEQSLTRLLRHAMTMRIFCESTTGMVAHTNISKLLRKPHVHDWMSAFVLVNNTTKSIYELMAANPKRAQRFGGAMTAYASSPPFDISYLINFYDWASLQDQAQIVDVGGEPGALAKQLAQQYPSLRVLVQDDSSRRTHSFKESEASCRIMAHDMFLPQNVPADIYILRWVLHNWADKYAIKILKALVPMLKSGTRVLINEICMPDSGEIPLSKEKNLRIGWECKLTNTFFRAMDPDMATVFNSHERDLGQWSDLLAMADNRFEIKNVTQPPGSMLAIIEVVWNG